MYRYLSRTLMRYAGACTATWGFVSLVPSLSGPHSVRIFFCCGLLPAHHSHSYWASTTTTGQQRSHQAIFCSVGLHCLRLALFFFYPHREWAIFLLSSINRTPADEGHSVTANAADPPMISTVSCSLLIFATLSCHCSLQLYSVVGNGLAAYGHSSDSRSMIGGSFNDSAQSRGCIQLNFPCFFFFFFFGPGTC